MLNDWKKKLENCIENIPKLESVIYNLVLFFFLSVFYVRLKKEKKKKKSIVYEEKKRVKNRIFDSLRIKTIFFFLLFHNNPIFCSDKIKQNPANDLIVYSEFPRFGVHFHRFIAILGRRRQCQ